jgi:salicylate hydroxylase
MWGCQNTLVIRCCLVQSWRANGIAIHLSTYIYKTAHAQFWETVFCSSRLMPQPLRLIIVGGGIGGLACAIASRRQGLDVLVLEKAEKLTPVRLTCERSVAALLHMLVSQMLAFANFAQIGAGIQIPPNATRIWAQYDLLAKLKEHSVVLEATQLRRWKDGELLCSRSVGEALDERWPWLCIHRADYQSVLYEEAKRIGVEVRLKTEVSDVDFDTSTVRLKSGEIVTGDAIIGADGMSSPLTCLR